MPEHDNIYPGSTGTPIPVATHGAANGDRTQYVGLRYIVSGTVDSYLYQDIDLTHGWPTQIVGTVPLPSGASTSALQTAGNASLTSLATQTVGLALEAGNLATIAGKDFATQTTLAALNAKLPALGQALAAASLPVVLTAIQQTALTPPAAITGFALEAGHLATIDAKVPALGQALAAASVPVVLTASQLSTLTPFSTVTANAGTNLNTSLLALESGGKLASIDTKITACNTGAVVLAAGTSLVGVTVSPPQTGALYSGTTALTPKFAVVTASASGATTIVALVTSKKIRVLSAALVTNGAVNVKWQSHTTVSDLTGLFYLGANGGYILPFSPLGHFETVAGEALDINLSGAVAVGGVITYVEV